MLIIRTFFVIFWMMINLNNVSVFRFVSIPTERSLCSVSKKECIRTWMKHHLYRAQELVGGASVFEPFLRSYLQLFKFSTVSTDEFRTFFNSYFDSCEAIQAVDWNTWLYSPGMILLPSCPTWNVYWVWICRYLIQRIDVNQTGIICVNDKLLTGTPSSTAQAWFIQLRTSLEMLIGFKFADIWSKG